MHLLVPNLSGRIVYLDQLPFLPGAVEYADQWLFPGGAHKNKKFYNRHVRWMNGVTDEMQMLLYTPETSGGLLLAVPSQRLETLTTRFAEEKQPCWVIGEVLEGQGMEVTA